MSAVVHNAEILPAIPDRSKFIGGSEIAAILGLNRYTSPFDVWLEKTGRASIRKDSAPAYWGRKLERLICEEYEVRRKVTLVMLFKEPRTHPERSWQGGSPDAEFPEAKRVIEAKAPGLRQAYLYGEPGSDHVPDEHLLQAHWYLSLEDFDRADIAVLLGGQDFRIYEIARDRELEAALLERAYDFWTRYVQADEPPEVTDTERTRDWLRQTFPKETLGIRKATQAESEIVEHYRQTRAGFHALEAARGDYEAKLKALIGEAAGLEGEEWRITYKAAKDAVKVDWEAVAAEYAYTLGLIAMDAKSASALAIRETVEEVLRGAPKRHTTTKPGSRRFLPRWVGEGEGA